MSLIHVLFLFPLQLSGMEETLELSAVTLALRTFSLTVAHNGVHNPPGRAIQNLLCYKINCKCKSADATRADRPGRVHAVLGAHTSRWQQTRERIYQVVSNLADVSQWVVATNHLEDKVPRVSHFRKNLSHASPIDFSMTRKGALVR